MLEQHRKTRRLTALGAGLACAVALVVVSISASAQELYGTLQKIKESGTITIGHREAAIPFSYLDDNQQVVGFSIDLCMRVVEEVKKELGIDELEVRFVPVNPQTRIPLIANETTDIECGSTSNNLTRQRQVAFGPTFFIAGTRLLVKKGSGISEIEDLEGKIVGVAQGTANERIIEEMLTEHNIDARMVHVREHAEGMVALETDRVDAYSTDDILLHGLTHRSRNPDDFEVVGRYLSYEYYAMMMRRDDSAFNLVVTRTLADMFRNGEIEAVFDKWFDPMGVPMSDLVRAAYEVQALPH